MNITSSFTIVGMTCDHCVRAVHDELAGLDGVTGVVVDLGSGNVRIESTDEIDPAAVAVAVAEAGYEVAT